MTIFILEIYYTTPQKFVNIQIIYNLDINIRAIPHNGEINQFYLQSNCYFRKNLT